MTRITHLEEALYEDKQGAVRDRLLEQLRQAEAQICAQLRAPQTVEAYAALLRCAQTSASAQVVIETLWARYHCGAMFVATENEVI
jgi:type III secretion system YseE family protein